MKSVHTLAAAVLAVCGMALAQAPTPPPATSVNADGTVTFRLMAPGASSVELDADYPINKSGYGANRKLTPLTRDSNGLWSLTTQPLKPDFYGYSYVVDGARMPDPGNPRVTRDGVRMMNWADVTGPASANYEYGTQPHGNVTQVFYPSPTLNLTRRVTVWTPPGYDPAAGKRYPVLYLVHGGGGDEEAWSDMGRAPEILDNLSAQGKIVPMIVVLPNGNEWQEMSPNDKPVPVPPGGNSQHILAFPDSLVKDLVPFIDAHYKTEANRDHRAIAGLSRGGAQSMYAAMNHLDMFTYLGVFSGGLPLFPGVLINIPRPADADTRRGPDLAHSIDPVKFAALMPALGPDVNKKLKLFYATIGTSDGLVESWQDARKVFDSKGVKYTWVELPDYGHEWRFWRLALEDFTPRLFVAGK